MKKITRLLASILTIFSLTLVPVTVHAQVVEEVPSEVPAQIPETGAEVKAPDTGIAPSSKVVQNTAVFVGGSLLGAGIGLGVLALKKQKTNQ